MTKFNQACTKYSAKCIQQFPFDPHTWRVAQNFHKAPFLHWNSPETLQKINKILIGSVIRHFSASEKNSFFWRQAHFFPTVEVLPKCAFSLGPDILLKQNLGFNSMIYNERLLMVTSFFTFEPPNNNHRKKYMKFQLVLKNLSTCSFPFHEESLLLVATPLLSR